MNKDKLLIFIDWFSPGFRAGGPVSSNVNLANHLQSSAEISVLTSDTEYCEHAPYPGIEPNRYLNRNGIQICYLNRKQRMSNLFRFARSGRDSVWFINGVFSRCFSILPLLLARFIRPRKVVLSPRGMFSPHAFAVRGFRKKLSVRLLKLLGFYRGITFHAASEREADDIRALLGTNVEIHTIDNLPPVFSPVEENRRVKRPGELVLISAARISPEKNTLFALRALRHCRTKITFHLFGQIYDAEYWAQCQAAIRELPDNIKILAEGPLPPPEIAAAFDRADLLFLPTRGENFGNAILESLLHNVPVLISDQTPWRGLEAAGVGWDLPLEREIDFAAVIDRCAEQTENEYAEFRKNCASYIAGKTNLKNNIDAYLSMFFPR